MAACRAVRAARREHRRGADHDRTEMDPDRPLPRRRASPLVAVRLARRDVNTCQEQLAGAWLLRSRSATPLCRLPAAMGAKIGRDVWFETLAVTEFDLVRSATAVLSTATRHRDAPVPRPPDADRPRHPGARIDARPQQRRASRHHDRAQLSRRRPLGRDARRATAGPHTLAWRARGRGLMRTDAIPIASSGTARPRCDCSMRDQQVSTSLGFEQWATRSPVRRRHRM